MENAPQLPTPSPPPRSTDFDVDPATFSAATWLNAVLSSPTPPTLATLHDTLSDSLRESHETLDTALRDALKAVPWVVRESERVRQRANTLRTNVDTVRSRVANVETGVVSSVKTIADADTVVRRVQETVTLLETAANADVLLERLESLLASAGADGADLVAAADVVSQLRKALQPLDGVPELKDRFSHLERADARLEKLAAPQLLKALESRNRQAAINARIVFDHAGRENAFRTQYVNLRGSQVRDLWTSAWTSAQASVTLSAETGDEPFPSPPRPEDGNTEKPKVTPPSTLGDFAANEAEPALRNFYDQLAQLLLVEAEWLQDAFPDVKTLLLPALVCDSLGDLSDPSPRVNVFVSQTAANPISLANNVSDNLHNSALCAITAAARIGKIFLPDSFSSPGNVDDNNPIESTGELDTPVSISGEEDGEKVYASLMDSLTSLLMPHRKFWENLVQSCVRQARTQAEAVTLSSITGTATARKTRPPLGEIARDVETSTKEACTILDSLLSTVNSRSCGVGIEAMKQTSGTISSTIAERLMNLLRMPVGDGDSDDEWTQLNGALRLLVATGGLKRSWDGRKESAFAVAIGTATPVLEVVPLVQESGKRRVREFLERVEGGNLAEAGIVWELVRDGRLSQRVVTQFESLDAANDFVNVVERVHHVVYETMFKGITQRFVSFNSRELWGSEGGEGDGGIAGFSSSPLRYATEVADYLMTIPQQLEPFVPDEEDAKYAMPSSVYVFSKSDGSAVGKERKSVGKGQTADNGDGPAADGAVSDGAVSDGDVQDDGSMSFAGMWISVLAIGTMELYVEKICGLPKLSEVGTRQLATDVDYICNVMGSLGVSPTAEMMLVSALLECKKDTASFTKAAAPYESAEQRKLVRRVAAVRGINVTL